MDNIGSSPFNPRMIALSALGNNQAEGTPGAVFLGVTVNGKPKIIKITGISNASPVVITATNNFANGQSIFLPIVPGIIELSNNIYYIGSATASSFALYIDSGLTIPVNGLKMSPFIVNSIDEDGNLNSNTREVPVVFDAISGSWSQQLSKTNQEEREMGIEVARLTMEDQTFLGMIGYQQT